MINKRWKGFQKMRVIRDRINAHYCRYDYIYSTVLVFFGLILMLGLSAL